MKRACKIFGLWVILFLLTSCWDQKDLEKLLIVYGVGIDTSLDKNSDNSYLITIAFPTIAEDAPQKKMEYSTPAKSLADAYDKLQRKAYREISYDNSRVIVFGEDAAKLGIIHHIDAMLREPLFPGTARFAIVEGRAADLLAIIPPVSLFVSTFLYESIQQSSQSTSAPYITLRRFHNEFHTKGIEPVMPYITYSAVPGVIYVGCTALFQGDKLIEVLHGNHSQAILILRGEINNGYYTANYSTKNEELDNYISVRFQGGKSKITTELIDDELNIYHKISIKATLSEFTDYESVFDSDLLKEFEDTIANAIKGDLISTINILQKTLKNDNIGYGRYVRIEHPELFDPEDWNEVFSHTKIHLELDVSIKSVGISH